ncbi:MAG: ABC transporter ATP-binding protein [Verrucomicrobia bacterium 61-8]|nr:ABC transporter ATP-binding protein [Verrucomicrobiota bacterium]OJV19093.1 MAG: ABC transporter ATP-binding protein [Verrucomicrobia bacterium 61-8]
MNALEVHDLTVAYGDIRAVKGISFTVKQGEIFTLIGANGAGKTSTLRALSGMLKYGGKVVYQRAEIDGIAADKRVGLGLAHVPEGRGIFGNLTVMENLKLGAWLRKDKAGVAEDLERGLTAFPRLRERKDQAAGTLSGGEQQMLAVARALMSRPKTLLLDEPSMGLAPKLVQDIYRVVREINAQGVTIVLVEQNANLALKIAHSAAVLETGSISLAGTGAELLSDPRVQAAYLGA